MGEGEEEEREGRREGESGRRGKKERSPHFVNT